MPGWPLLLRVPLNVAFRRQSTKFSVWISCRKPPPSSQTAHSKSNFRTVRIIRPHHPLFGLRVPVIKLWEHKEKRYYIIQLPDKSNTRIPLHWVDEGNTPLPEVPTGLPILSLDSVRQLIFILNSLKASGA